MRRFWWMLAILIWAASAFASWMVMSGVAMFNGLDRLPTSAWLFFLAPLVALGGLGAGLVLRRKAAWLPSLLLLSPACQGIAWLWGSMETTF
jgi:hypothetical protein